MMTSLEGALAVLLICGVFSVWGRFRANARLIASAEHYRQARRDFMWPALPPELRDELDRLAAASSAMSTALRFRGQLLADRLRKRCQVRDVGLAQVMYELFRTGDSLERYSLEHELDPYTTFMHVLAAAATELSSLERDLGTTVEEVPHG